MLTSPRFSCDSPAMSATRSKFLPSIGEDLRLFDVLAPTACFLSFAFGFAVRCLLVLTLVALPLSAEPASKVSPNNTSHASPRCAPREVLFLSRPPAPLPASALREVFLPQCPVVTPAKPQGPVVERPPRVDRNWPERRMAYSPDLRDPHKWVREQEKQAWRFVDSIGK